MIVKSFISSLIAALPQNSLITFSEAIRLVEDIFGRQQSTVAAERSLLLRRHVNLLAALRAQGIMCVGDDKDVWHVEREPHMASVMTLDGVEHLYPTEPPQCTVQRKMTKATKYIEALVEGVGMVRYVREDDHMPPPKRLSKEQVKERLAAISLDGPYAEMDYSGGALVIEGVVTIAELTELLEIARAAIVPSPDQG